MSNYVSLFLISLSIILKKSILIFRFRSSASHSIPGETRETSRHPLLTFDVKDKGRRISEKKNSADKAETKKLYSS